MMTAFRVGLLIFAIGVAGSALACGGQDGGEPIVAACDESVAAITHGPRTGAVTQAAAKVWIRACRPVSVQVEYGQTPVDWTNPQATDPVATDPSFDNTAVVRLEDLQPNTEYQYRVVVADKPSDLVSGSFSTMAGPGGMVSFLVGSDLHPGTDPLPIFDVMMEQPADFAILFGDLIDIEPPVNAELGEQPPPPSPEGKGDYEELYQRTWSDAFFRRFMAERPTLMMWDDHEILNDWDNGKAQPYSLARAAFDEYQGMANPDPIRRGELYYTYRAGDAAFFVLDTRSYRSPAGYGDGPVKTMLGDQQKQDLKAWLLGSRAKFKFIVSSVMWADVAKHQQDAWRNYSTERSEIFDFIRDQSVAGVVLLSSDEHWNAVVHIPEWEYYEIAASSLGGIPFLQTFTADPQLIFKMGRTHAFGHYTVDASSCPAVTTFRIVNDQGAAIHEITLSQLDLGPEFQPLTAEAYCEAVAAGEVDSDGDGCTDAEERSDDKGLGGQRDPESRWDFYDVDHDGTVDLDDVEAVISRLGTRRGDTRYDPVFDRGPAGGTNAWDLGAPDGVVTTDDFFAVVAQMGDTCEGPQTEFP